MLTADEREKCAELFELFTGVTSESHTWNEKAAESLYKMIEGIRRCSEGMGWIPSLASVMPSNVASYLALYIYKGVKHQIQMNKKGHKVVKPCRDTAVIRWQDEIELNLMGL